MKIQVNSREQNINLSLPTNLIFSKFVLKLILKNGKHRAKIENLSPDAMDRILGELRKIAKKHKQWVLVEVDSANGEHVKITL